MFEDSFDCIGIILGCKGCLLYQTVLDTGAQCIFKMWSEDRDGLDLQMCGGLKAGCTCVSCTDVQFALDNSVDMLFEDFVERGSMFHPVRPYRRWLEYRLANGRGY